MIEYVNKSEIAGAISHCRGLIVFNALELAKTIDELPDADVAPVVHGRWYGESDGYADGYPVTDVWYCSECDHCIDDGTDDPDLLPNYCPNCGAKMDGERSDE